jgi:hypothetical protein
MSFTDPQPDAAGIVTQSAVDADADAQQPPTEAVPKTKNAPPVTVDQFTRRTDNDVLDGTLALVIAGEHAGQTAAFVGTVERDPQSGYPSRVLVRFRSASYDHEYAVVDYADLRPAEHPGHQ